MYNVVGAVAHRTTARNLGFLIVSTFSHCAVRHRTYYDFQSYMLNCYLTNHKAEFILWRKKESAGRKSVDSLIFAFAFIV